MKNTTITFVVVAVIAITIAITLGFVFSDSSKTVTFDQNYQDSNNIVVKVTNGDEVQSPYAVRAGYTLVGWYCDKECTKEAKFPCKITNNTTFYARWSDKMISTIFNEDYLTDTESGRALYNRSQITNGSVAIKINDQELNTLVVASGGSFLILDLYKNDNKYSVVGLDNYSIKFKIPSNDLIRIRTIGLDVFGKEFIVAQYYSGYYIYDLNGNAVGPAADVPTTILTDSILFNGSFYKFDVNGNIYAAFDATSSTHIPEGGNGNTFYELVSMNVGTKTYYLGANILNDKYQVIKYVKFDDKAALGACVTLAGGNYLIQYGIEGTSSTEYTAIKDGVSYIVRSTYINKDMSESKLTFNRLINKSYDRQNSPGINWDMYAHDTVSIVSAQAPGFENLSQMITISSNGKHVTIVDTINDQYWTSVAPLSTSYHYLFTEVYDLFPPIMYTNILDGSGHSPKVVLTDIANPNGVRYFIKIDDSTFGIYDINGNTVGNYIGYTYMGSSHNDLFFEKGGDCYIFRDAAMSKLCNGSDVIIRDWGYAVGETVVVSGQSKTTYTYYTEDGSKITTSAGKNNMEFFTNGGYYVINIQTASGEYRLYELKS